MAIGNMHSFGIGVRKGWEIASDPDPTALSRRRQEYLNRDLLAESWEPTGAQLNEAMNQAQPNDVMS
ncbi:MAG: hypothetical protein Q3979_02905 [Actinomycetaceae bacterium]|nr:hypothetical protein [Actinomycetaceae bacterium]